MSITPFLKIEPIVLEDSPVSDELLKEVQGAIQELPDSIHHFLLASQYKIVLSRLVVDFFPELKGQPLGDHIGWDLKKRRAKYFDNIKGAHDYRANVIVYPEYFQDLDTGELVLNQSTPVKTVLYHEIGHALDYSPSKIESLKFSEGQNFLEYYHKDVGTLTDADRENLIMISITPLGLAVKFLPIRLALFFMTVFHTLK